MKELLSRKFISSILVVILAYGLVFTGKLSAEVWLNMSVVTLGLYQVGNIATKALLKE
jgi:hypothetical protein